MKDRAVLSTGGVANWVFAATVASIVLSVVTEIANGRVDVGWIVVTAGMLGMGAVGRLIIVRTGNTIGWIFAAMGLAFALAGASNVYLQIAVNEGLALPATTFAAMVHDLAGMATLIPLALLFVLFPTGSPPSPRWRWLIWLWIAGTVLTVVWSLIRPNELWGDRAAGVHIANPLAASTAIGGPILTAGGAALFIAGTAGVISLFLRYRGAASEERVQIRWLMFVAGLGLAVFLLGQFIHLIPGNTQDVEILSNTLWTLNALLVTVGVPVAVTISILKYRLYDIDVVINKTIVFGALAAFITVVYVAIVVVVGAVFGSQNNTALSIAATAVVALAFQPVRSRVQKLANRLVYGQRATPYETLTRLSERAGSTYSIDEVLPNAARVIGEGLGAQRAEVWLLVGDRLRREATWPDPEAETTDAPVGDLVLPVELHGEQVGAIAVAKKRGEQLTPQEEELLRDVAGQAGLMMSNVRLTADLEARIEKIAAQAAELRASRQRIVAAQDEERRQLERNIHDGAQQHLVALAVKLRLAKAMLTKDPEKAKLMLQELRAQIDAALDTLDQLSLGIYPPLLESEGLAAALRAQFSQPDIRLELTDDGVSRQPIELEAAAYFCSLEALQNVAKYSGAKTVSVRLRQSEDELTFTIEDDGRGFDTGAISEGTGLVGMRDRLAVFGGTIDLESVPGKGTRVRGTIPVAAVVS